MEIRLELTTDNLVPAVRATVSALLSEKNLSVTEYSERAGVSKQTIENFLNGKSKYVKLDTLIKFIRGFDMTYNEFAVLVISHGKYSEIAGSE